MTTACWIIMAVFGVLIAFDCLLIAEKIKIPYRKKKK